MSSSNKVTLSGTSITNIQYIQNSLYVTSGESHDNSPSITNNGGGNFTIELNADRKGSTAVATGFIEVTGGAGHVAADGGGSTPSQLNFYFGVTLSVNTNVGSVPVTLYLGQGHYATTNNWWLGGNTFLQPPTVLLAISNNVIQREMKVTLDTSSFTFS